MVHRVGGVGVWCTGFRVLLVVHRVEGVGVYCTGLVMSVCTARDSGCGFSLCTLSGSGARPVHLIITMIKWIGT